MKADKKEPLFSIVIPVYNAQLYIAQCISSVMRQSFNNYEVIIVDDGSTDKTVSIAQNLIGNDDRFKIIRKPNEGVSKARNLGVSLANGEYICFVDSDDIISPSYLEHFAKIAIEHKKPDLICLNYAKFKTENDIHFNSNSTNRILKAKREDLLFTANGSYLFDKAFRRYIVTQNNIKFNTEIFMCEDLLFIDEYLNHSNNNLKSDTVVYYYRILESSASKNPYNVKWFTIFQALNLILLNPKNDPIRDKIAYSFYYYIYYAKYRISNLKKLEDKKYAKNLVQKNYRNDLKKYLTRTKRLKLFIIKYFGKIIFFTKEH